MRKLTALALACVLAATPVAGQPLPELGDSSATALSPQMERRIGEMAITELRRDASYLDDPEVNSYLNAIGQRLAAAGPDPRQNFIFFALRDPTVNAFAIPGGVIGVHTGLITTAQTESELASVLGHEIAHVTQRHMARQVAAQQQLQPLMLLALAVGILAARSNPGMTQAAIVGSQAAQVQAFLNYSRDFEREADRIGFQTLQAAGFDVSGMPSFFERLQKSTRLYENNAPAYLRTHPLTSERIADMQGRSANEPYRQTPDSIEFRLVRAKLLAEAGTPQQAVTTFEGVVKERRFADEVAARYGYARALLRAKSYAQADAEMTALRKTGAHHPMIENLAASIKRESGDPEAARVLLEAAMKEFPANLALGYNYVETLQALGRYPEALDAADRLAKAYPLEPRVHELMAKTYGALGRRTAQHRALAEFYLLQGSLPAAIEQLQLARNAGDADFYTLSAVDARLRDLRGRQAEEKKELGK
ncbi:MAG: M48 family metalloprotease [Burkholderiales bacterium]|jgi:predicted Zn-dependent protease|nr:M48 family metalloprotease [Burkholderiales bacterium]